MKLPILLSLLFASQVTLASKLNCVVSISLDDSDSQATAVPLGTFKLSTEATSSEGDAKGKIKIKVGKQKAQYSCVGIEEAQLIEMKCTPITQEDFSEEDLLLVKLSKKSATKWLGTAYVNDGDNETFENISCK